MMESRGAPLSLLSIWRELLSAQTRCVLTTVLSLRRETIMSTTRNTYPLSAQRPVTLSQRLIYHLTMPLDLSTFQAFVTRT